LDPYESSDRPAARIDSSARRTAALILVGTLVVGGVVGVLGYRFFFDRGQVATEPRAITPRGDYDGEEKTNIAIFKNVSPSVAYITTLAERVDPWTLSVTEYPEGTGSGFVWDDGGSIVTNFHVVARVAQRGGTARVTLADHTAYDAQLVGVAPNYDLAVLRISAPRDKLKPIPVGSSADLQVGQKVFAIGNPFGLDQSLTTGVVSQLGRTIRSVTDRAIEDVIQTDAAINPGNSGGPLLDSAGRLIGVNTAIYSPSGGSAGVGFAIPVDTVNRVVPQLIKNGRILRPKLGIVAGRMRGVEGVLVLSVQKGTPAENAGLRGTQRSADGATVLGDIIVAVGAKPVRTAEDLNAELETQSAGDTISLSIVRDRRKQDVQVKLGNRE
jgi:S1-C subfamily serine protease